MATVSSVPKNPAGGHQNIWPPSVPYPLCLYLFNVSVRTSSKCHATSFYIIQPYLPWNFPGMWLRAQPYLYHKYTGTCFHARSYSQYKCPCTRFHEKMRTCFHKYPCLYLRVYFFSVHVLSLASAHVPLRAFMLAVAVPHVCLSFCTTLRDFYIFSAYPNPTSTDQGTVVPLVGTSGTTVSWSVLVGFG